MKLADKQALIDWEKYRRQVDRATSIDLTESPVEQKKRITRLEADDEAWFKYYFPNYYKSEPASFHIAATQRWMNHNRWYEVRAWSRELAKSARAMMEDMKLLLTGNAKVKLLVSDNEPQALRLITPYKINLETNQRIIHDYGDQKSIGQWEENFFISKRGFAIACFGALQGPRGFRLEEVRPDIVDFDDMDTDEDVRNPEQVKKKWEKIEKAVIPTVSISGNKRFRFNGNIIAKYCCITEAMKKADYVEVINIRDKNGKSTWPQKNSEEDIDYLLSKISYIAAQQEYFNNPISEGTVFKEMHYKKMQPLSHYKFLVCYIDLSYKSSTKNDYKAAVLMGKYKDEYHIIRSWLKQGTTRELAMGLIDIQKFVADRVPVYWIAEENFLQDIIRKDLQGNFTELGSNIVITPDTRKKPDKFHRIESTLEPLNTNGKLFLNIDEKENPHMQTLDDQFRCLEPGSRAHDDGPDACEGAKHIIDSKQYSAEPMFLCGRRMNNKRF